jgi:protein SCO1/2
MLDCSKTTRRRWIFSISFVLAPTVSATSCSENRERAASEKHYKMAGVVLALDPKLQTAKIKHGPIEGWMEAMTMDYPIRSKSELNQLHVGDHITATVNVRGTDYDLTGIKKQNTAQ